MIPILYEKTENTFTSNGIGRLTDAISCEVQEELNGLYELTMTYPKTGQYAKELTERRFIFAKPNQVSNPQPFRIYKVTKQMNRIVVNAQHLSYDLNGFPVAPFSATGVTPALNGLVSNSMLTNPFSVWTDITNTTSNYTQNTPASFRERLGGVRGSILDTFLGEFEWDKFTVKLHAHRGADNGVTIRYGKNLTEFENERSTEAFYTGCLAYWEKDDVVVQGTIQYITNHSNYPNEKIFMLDASSDFDDAPTQEQLDNYAAEYITNNNLGLPFKDNLKINFIPLWQTEEYKNVAPLERVSLGDTVHVLYEEFNVSMKVISYYFDCLSERYVQMELGTKKASLAETITSPIQAEIDSNIETAVSNLEEAIAQATALLSGGLGGYVVINTNADGTPNEILLMDSPSMETAVNVIRMNKNGIGFSTTGYNGAFRNAWTIDGHLNADFIDVGTLNGNLIQASSILTSALEVSAYEAVSGTISNVTYDGTGMHIARKDADGNIVSAYQSLFTELGMRVINNNNEATLIAEGDTVDAINLTARNFFRVNTDVTETGTVNVYHVSDRFQGFWSVVHNAPMVAVFWEEV